MTIASELTKLNTNMQNAYTACDNKGATLPQAQNMDNLATCISSISSGSSPVISSLSITPTTSQQTITAPSGTDGYSPITVSAVTSSIDSNISAGNIKSGVSILGVSGSVTELKGETKSVSLTNKNGQTFTPSSGKNGITSITVTPNNQARTVIPTTSSQSLTVNSGYSGNGTITVNAVTSSIDANITAGNIKKNVTILGITGTYEGSGSATLITKSITQNGIYNASSDNADGYSRVTVNVSGGGIGITREVKNGVYQMPTTSFTFSLPSDATNLGDNSLYYAFYNCTGLTSLYLSSLTTVSGYYSLYNAFYGCTGLTSVDLSSLTTLSGSYCFYYAFRGCTGLTSVDLSSLTTLSGSYCFYYAFYGCTGLTSVDLSSLTTLSGSSGLSNAFYGCKGLTDIYFRALTTSSFGSYKNQFNGMMSGTGSSKTHTLHFPSNLQSTISGLSGYPNFGGTSGYVTLSFDLPTTS